MDHHFAGSSHHFARYLIFYPPVIERGRLGNPLHMEVPHGLAAKIHTVYLEFPYVCWPEAGFGAFERPKTAGHRCSRLFLTAHNRHSSSSSSMTAPATTQLTAQSTTKKLVGCAIQDEDFTGKNRCAWNKNGDVTSFYHLLPAKMGVNGVNEIHRESTHQWREWSSFPYASPWLLYPRPI